MTTGQLQMRRYLNAARRRWEVVGSLFCAALGGGTLMFLSGGHDPMAWVVGSELHHALLAWWLLGWGLVHAVGIRANGRWGVYSTALRLAAMVGQVGALMVLSVSGYGSTAFMTYGFVAGILAYGAFAAWSDCRLAVLGVRYD